METASSFRPLRWSYAFFSSLCVVVSSITWEVFSQDIWGEYRKKYVGKIFEDERQFLEEAKSLYYLRGAVLSVFPVRTVFLYCFDTVQMLYTFVVLQDSCDTTFVCNRQMKIVDVLAFNGLSYTREARVFVGIGAVCYLDSLTPGIEEAICTDTVGIAIIKNTLGKMRIPHISDDIVKMWILEPHKVRFEEFDPRRVYYESGGSWGNFYVDEGIVVKVR